MNTRKWIGIFLVIGGILAGAVWGEWSEPIKLQELNYQGVAALGSLTEDECTILFFRNDNLMEGWRADPSGPFTDERLVSELGSGPTSIRDAWVSADGLRLYYAEIISLGGKLQRVIKCASRTSLNEAWTPVRTFLEIHVNGIIDTSPTLTADELTMIWYSQRFIADPEVRKYTATRASIDEPFTDIRELTEFRDYTNAVGLHLSGDGLRVYFTAYREDIGFRNIYMGSRASLDDSFGDIHVVEGISGPTLQGGIPWLTADEKTFYFTSHRDGEGGIWVSYWEEDLFGAAVERVEAAIAGKRDVLACLTAGLDDDRLALEALEALACTGEVDPVIILRSKLEIFRSIKRQIMAIRELERSIADLEKSLMLLQSSPRRSDQALEKIRDKQVGPPASKVKDAPAAAPVSKIVKDAGANAAAAKGKANGKN